MIEEKKLKEVLNKIFEQNGGDKSALIPVLQEIQEELGYIPSGAIEPVAEALGLFPSQVQGVITFYAQFYTTPRGKNIIRVCRGTACHVKGGRSILRIVKNELGIDDGQTTEDFKFSLETVACIGACALAPTMVINRETYGQLKAQTIIDTIQYATRS